MSGSSALNSCNFEDALLRPASKAFIDGAPTAVFTGQESPLRSRTGNPQHSFKEAATLVFLSDADGATYS
jgi:hypothetical protein